MRRFLLASLLSLVPFSACEEELWTEAFDANEAGAGSVSGVWAAGKDDVFVVGGETNAGTVFRFDGSEWSQMEHPEIPLLVWVHGFGADDVWAVGTGGGVMHFDGTNWTRMDAGTDVDLWGVFGENPDDIWIVGGFIDEGEPVLIHWNGTDFEPYDLPEDQRANATAIFKVFSVEGDFFAVGQNGLILAHDGTDWLRQGAGPLANDDFVSLWGTSRDNLVAVGGRGNARIATFDGTEWTTVAPEGLGGLNAIYFDSADEVVVGGVSGLGGLFDRNIDDVVSEETGTGFDIHALFSDGDGGYVAVGGNFLDPFRGVVLFRRGGAQ